ncbi:MAG: UDP-N-acetylmuramyl-tripeptide synthetase [Candidatus Doudnabacteria bacterium]|nr:UDP-N-acetylmuramyl-tripeptide synthetase [Candidatus Doudnabacteria bacterium]
MWLKNIAKKIVGKKLVSIYHFHLARLAALVYGFPSRKLIVVGVTGTNGKSTTANLLAKILEEAGNKVAVTSTINFKIGEKDKLNDQKMTMPGRFFLQRFLRQAVQAGCQYAIIETSSEGVAQHRHIGIHYDALVFTNLTPEHLEAHGGFENYKAAKLTLFEYLEKLPYKMLNGQQVEKVIVANADDPYFPEFVNFKVDRIVSFGKNSSAQVQGSNLTIEPKGISFEVDNLSFRLQLKGQFDFYNALVAIAAAEAFGVGLDTCKKALEKIPNVPGRMEVIQSQPFTIVVDYAYEPEEMRQVYETISRWKPDRVIQVLGPSGGGRDKARISILGEMAGKFAAVVFITTDDPYDDDPAVIGRQMFEGASKSGKQANMNLFLELDRREAIALALKRAQPGDLVLITGKGSDQKMAVKGGYVPWDDRQVVREQLAKL